MKQVQALRVMLSGESVFLTGAPGSGKTYLIRDFIKRSKQAGKRLAVTASTGIAATHIGGATIHSWSGLGIKEDLSDEDMRRLKLSDRLLKRYNNVDVLIIDEVSMLQGKRLDMINEVCKVLRDSDKPFGGVQVVLIGDLFQLPPVNRSSDRVDFVHMSAAWAELNPKVCYLSEQHRQSGDMLLDLLSAMRANEVSQAHYDSLSERLVEGEDDSITKLYTHNVDVEQINNQHLQEIDSESKHYVMETYGRQAKIEQLTKSVLAPEQLELKAGAEVMFVANIPMQGLANGTRATVIGFNEEGLPEVRLHDSGRKVVVKKHDWALEEDGREAARVSQLPIRLAWAITIHKSQGMSLDGAVIDLSKAFTPGMGYVALSRVRSLDGVYLKGINNTAMIMHPDIFEFDVVLKQDSDLLSQETSQDPIDDEEVKNSVEAGNPDSELLGMLRAWRSEEAKKRSLPLYMIASNSALNNIASTKPISLKKLAVVAGVGPKIVDRYGQAIVDIVCAVTGEVSAEDKIADNVKKRLNSHTGAWSDRDVADLVDSIKKLG